MSNKINGLINNSIASEQKWQEGRRKDWLWTKKFLRQIDESKLPPETTVYCGSGSITIRVKWGVENLRQARIAMGSGWEFSNNYTDSNGTFTKSYHKYGDAYNQSDPYSYRPYVSLSLIMDSTALDPETCKRIEVGEKTYTQKIYQVICEDGIKEVLGRAEELDVDK